MFFESSNPISDVFDITTLYEKEDKNEIILNFLSEVLKNFKEEQLNEILSVENFRVYSQIRYYLKNIDKAPLPTFKIPISFQQYFNDKTLPQIVQRPLYRAPVIKTNLIQPIEEEEQFNERHSAGGSFKRQRTIKVIRKY